MPVSHPSYAANAVKGISIFKANVDVIMPNKLLCESLHCCLGGFPSVRRLGVLFFLKDIFEMSMSVNAKK